MNKSVRVAVISLALSGATLVLGSADLQAQDLAFPTAQGFGATTKGGRGGIVCHVDTLGASTGDGGKIAGSPHYRGSFPYCFGTLGVPRTIVFDVGGRISLSAQIGRNMKSNVTLACQTAPGNDGVYIGGTGEVIITAGQVIIRHCRFRSTGGTGFAAGQIGEPSNFNQDYVIIDHSSMTWHHDETYNDVGNHSGGAKVNCITSSGPCAKHHTVQWSIIAEGIGPNRGGSGNGTGSDSKCLLHYGNSRVSYIKNMVLNCSYRMPMQYDGEVEYVNNLFYNGTGPGVGLFYGYWQPGYYSLIGNQWQPGPNDVNMPGPGWRSSGSGVNRIFVKGNRHPGKRPNDTAAYGERCIFDRSGAPPGCSMGDGYTGVSSPPVAGMMDPNDSSIETAENALVSMLAADGAGPFMPRYDMVDSRQRTNAQSIINQPNPASRSGQIPRSAGQIVWPSFQVASRPASYDTDRDGLPDSYEDQVGLDKNDGLDGARVASGETYYTNLEMYLNEVAGDSVSGSSSGDAEIPSPPTDPRIVP